MQLSKPYSRLHLWISVIISLTVLIGFLYSRALLSISIFLLLAHAFLPYNIKTTINRLRSNRFIWACFLYYGMYAISGLWSTDMDVYLKNMVLKLPFILLPIGMAGLPYESPSFRRLWLWGILLLILINMLYSIGAYISNPDFYIEGYAHSKQIPTTVYGDHIRFSLWICVNLVFLYWCWQQGFKLLHSKMWNAIFIISYVLISIFFIHLLSAKTGLLALYITIGLLGLAYISKKVNVWIATLVSIIGGIILIAAAYNLIPTFQTKVAYMKTQYEMVQQGQALDYNYSDLGRIISYKVSRQAISQQPWYGAGAGDIMSQMNQAYDAVHPEVPKDSRWVPINQYLTEVLGFGFIFSIIFWVMLVSGIRRKAHQWQSYTILIFILMLSSMMVEAMLQIQMGIVVYLYLTMIWYYWVDDLDTARLSESLTHLSR